jgi:hypothetical protein
MIEKKIKYDINIEKPSKTKPVKQGGVFNYLGKQKTVSAPVKWRSSKDHPIAHLSYITKDEQKILIDLNLYGSLKGKPNKGPFGLPSLQGSGSGSGGDSGGDSGGQGDSGPGGSDDGTGHGGPGPGSPGGESTGDANDQGGTAGPGGPGSVGPSNEGFGIGPEAEAEAAASNAAANIGVTQTALDALDTLTSFAKDQMQKAIDNPVQTAIGIMNPVAGLAFGLAKDAYSGYARGVTAPDDFSQLDTSVQTGPAQSTSGGGIVDLYAPLYNSSTGNPTMDAYIRQLRINLGLPV